MNTSRLRGKKLNLIKPQAKYAKVPMSILSHQDLTPVDKLIFAYLYSQSDSGNYILAYTRIAKELNIDKSNLIKRWKWFIKNGYIKEDDKNYYVTIGAEDKLHGIEKGSFTHSTQESSKGSPTPLEEDNHEAGKSHLLGGINQPNEEVSDYLNGSPMPSIEYNKEEKIKTEQGIEVDNSSLEGKHEMDTSENNHSSRLGNHTSNDLVFLLNNSPIFKNYYETVTSVDKSCHGVDISTYSNIYIAYVVGQRVKKEPTEVPINIQKMLTIMVKFSQQFEDSNLWKCFLDEIEYNTNYIQELNSL